MAFQFIQAFECELDPDVIKGGRVERAQIVELVELRWELLVHSIRSGKGLPSGVYILPKSRPYSAFISPWGLYE